MRLHSKFATALIAAIACAVGTTATASADIITWSTSTPLFTPGSPTGPDAQAFITTDNEFVLGFNATSGGDDASADSPVPGTETVNGVTFTNVTTDELFAGFTSNGVTAQYEAISAELAGGDPADNPAVRDTPSAFGSGSITDPNVNNLLEGGVFDEGRLTLTGLTAGLQYELQILTNDARTGATRDNLWQVGFSDGEQSFADSFADGTAGISILNNRDPDTLTGETSGNFITGTFTATSDTISFETSGTRNAFGSLAGGQAQINALQLRVVAVPEPSSVALLGLGAIGFVVRRRRK